MGVISLSKNLKLVLFHSFGLQVTHHSDDMAPALPSRRSLSALKLCNTSSGVLKKGQAGNKGLYLASGDEERKRRRNMKIGTLCVSLQVPGQLHGEDGVEQGGDESSIQATHRPKHFEEQQPQRHTVLLHGSRNKGKQRCCFIFQNKQLL